MDVLGDLEEEYALCVEEKGTARAMRWYWSEVGLALPAFLKRSVFWSFTMLQNYLKIAFRSIQNRKGVAFINIIGLAVGLACCLMMALYVHYELSYDRHHRNADRTYRVIIDEPGTSAWATTTWEIGAALADTFPDIEQAVRFKALGDSVMVSVKDKQFKESGMLYATANVLDAFTIPLMQGDLGNVLTAPYTTLISERMAENYFGDEDPLGQVLSLNRHPDLTVTGVIANQPATTHLPFDFLVSMATLYELAPDRLERTEGWSAFYTYVLLDKAYNQVRLDAQLSTLLKTIYEDQVGEAQFVLQPLTDIYLHSHLEKELYPNGDVRYVYLFSFVALFVLGIAGINFTNLTTARSIERAKEVGVRKAVGAEPRGMISQFLTESIVMAFIAMLLAVVLAIGLLPLFGKMTGTNLSGSLLLSPRMSFLILGIALVVGLLAGCYPAFILSRFHPSQVLKGQLLSASRGVGLRRGLVVFQFGISIFLIIGAIVVSQQLTYLLNRGVGFEKDEVVVLQTSDYVAAKEALLKLSGVVDVSGAKAVPGQRFGNFPISIEGMPAGAVDILRGHRVDHNYLEMLGIEMVSGHSFAKLTSSGTLEGFILNEAAVAYLYQQYDLSGDIVGKEFTWWWGGQRTGEVIGVVQDFNFASLHNDIEPLVLLTDAPLTHTLVRLRQGQVEQSLGELEAVWRALEPGSLFSPSFLDERLNSLYDTEQRLSSVLGSFTFIAIVIACLGLLGLAAFTMEQRTKEIGIRKALGASVSGIIVLLSKEYALLIVLAFCVACPAIYIVMKQWLEGFAYHVEMAWETFLLAGLLALGIALLTVSHQAIKAALSDPVKVLRYE